MEKVSVFIKIRVLWPEISALGVFLNFDNELMRPPKYPSAPPPGYVHVCTYYPPPPPPPPHTHSWSMREGLLGGYLQFTFFCPGLYHLHNV